MSLRGLHLGAVSLTFASTLMAAQPPRGVEREGGLLPPLPVKSTTAAAKPPVVQVVAKQPAEDEEILVELIKVMPRVKEEVKAREAKNDNFRVIKIKREESEAPKPIETSKVVTKPVKQVNQEPLKFVPTAKQEAVPTLKPSPKSEPASPLVDQQVKVVKVPVSAKKHVDEDTTWPSMPNPFSGYPGAIGDACLEGIFLPPRSAVGWIDPATIATRARLRSDARYHNDRPDRAEFFTARNQQFFGGIDEGISGRGFPIPERSINMKENSLYVEYAFTPRVSAFVEGVIREMDPLENANHSGFGDMNTGFRVAYFLLPDQVQTFQLRIFAPTGRTEAGLGNGHATLEPALLLWQSLGDGWALESEIRDWIPLGGTNYAGNVLRYGLGLSYEMYRNDYGSITPVAEIIGWSVLRGKESRFVNLLPTFQETFESRGTIFEAAFGVRGQITGNCDWYLGYARTLSTAKAWFDDNLRLEVRWNF
jgi:hypothetical protein